MPSKPRFLHPEFPIHITARSNNRESFPLPIAEMWQLLTEQLFLASVMYGLRYRSFVLMPNHFHLIARDPNANLSAAMNYFMRETSKEIGRRTRRINRIWGSRFHSSVLLSPLYYLHAYKYVYRNPVKARLVGSPSQYQYSSLHGLLGFSRLLIPIEEDMTLFDNVEGTIRWINESYEESEEETVRRALKRKEFKFRAEPSSRGENRLNSWDSVPAAYKITEKKQLPLD